MPPPPILRSTSRPTLAKVEATGGGYLIELTMGQFAIIDECDFAFVAPYTWCATPSRHGKTHWAIFTEWYVDEDGRRRSRTVSMHRAIMGFPEEMVIDHADGDGLNNRRCNLRLCTVAENSRNMRQHDDTINGFKGVYRTKAKAERFGARIFTSGRLHHIGSFASPEEAAKVYDAAALECFGEFARLNFPLSGEVNG